MPMLPLLATLLSAAPLDGCTVTGPEPGVDRKIQCTDAKAFVSPEAPKTGTDGLVQLYLAALKNETGSRAKAETLTIVGNKVPGVRYQDGRIAVVPSGNDKVRAIGCEAKRAQRCDAILAELAAKV